MALAIAKSKTYFSPFSEDALRKFKGRGRFYDYMLRFAAESMIYIQDDFLNEVLEQTYGYWISQNTGTSSAVAIVPDTANGILRITGGTSDNGGGHVAGQLAFYGDLNCGMITAVKTSVITDVKIEAGFTDSQTETNSVGAVNNLATPTSTASDYAVMIVDTDDTTNAHGKIWHFASDGSTSNMNATATVNTKSSAIVAATYDKLCVGIEGNKGWGYLNGWCIAKHGDATATQVEGGTVLCPWLHAQTRSTTSKTIDFDYIVVWQDRE